MADGPAPSGEARTAVVRVWDPLLRVLHWGLAVSVVGAILTAKFGPAIMTWHFTFGYATGVLLLVRLVWGVAGPPSARFARFVAGPRALIRYIATLGTREPSRWPGHAPLGGWATVVILGVLTVHVAMGLMADPEDFLNRGPLARSVGIDMARTAYAWHARLAPVIMALIVLHLLAIAFYAIWKRENLVKPMITGLKRVEQKPRA